MSNDSINSISPVVQDPRSAVQAAASRSETAKPELQPKNAAVEPVVTEEQGKVSKNPDVQMMFQVDEKTKDLTVFILDRSSKEVIRTIPPDEVNKLKAGDLVSLFT
jgi:uncharacterized FlaG/YvyC family protein